MRKLLLFLLASLAAFAAADDWAKVKALKTGAELRVYRRGSAQPISAQMADLTDDNLIVLIKKTESAIPRDQIERIDARASGVRPVTKQDWTTKQTTGSDGSPSTSSSSGLSIGSKPDFETVYRRPMPPPKK
jgi:hypothetical protein